MAQPLWMTGGTPLDQAAMAQGAPIASSAAPPPAIPATPENRGARADQSVATSSTPVWQQGGTVVDQTGAASQPPAMVPPPTPPTPGFWGPPIDFAKNIGTGFEQAGADIAGFPKAFDQWISQYIPPDPGSFAANPNQTPPRWWPKGVPLNPPTTPAAMKAITDYTGLDYVPSTPEGRIVQRAAEYGGGALLGGPFAGARGVTIAAAGGAASQAGQEAGYPDWLNTMLGFATPLVADVSLSGLETLLRPTTVAGQEAKAGQVLREVATNPNAPVNPPLIEGSPQTFGMATDDLGTRAFEKGRFSTAPMSSRYTQMQKDVSEATTNALNQGITTLPNRASSVMQMENSASQMHQQMTDTKAAARANEGAAWDVVDPNNTLTTPITPIADAMTAVKQDLIGSSRGDLFPNYVDRIMSTWGPNPTLNQVKGLRTRVLNDIRDAQSPTNPNSNFVDAVSPVAKVLTNTMDSMASTVPGQQAALNTARATSRNFHTIYDNKNVQQALNGGASKAGNILNTPEGVDAYHAATGGAPAAMDAARRYFMAGLARDAINQDGNLSASAFNNNLRDNQSLITDPRYFTPDQADLLNRAGQHLNSLQQTPRVGMQGVSPTHQLLSQQDYAEALAGKTGAALANVVGKAKVGASAWLGSHLGPVGTMIGGLVGMTGKAPYTEAGQNVLKLVDEALTNPALAARLRGTPSLPSTSPLSVRALQAIPNYILMGGSR